MYSFIKYVLRSVLKIEAFSIIRASLFVRTFWHFKIDPFQIRHECIQQFISVFLRIFFLAKYLRVEVHIDLNLAEKEVEIHLKKYLTLYI